MSILLVNFRHNYYLNAIRDAIEKGANIAALAVHEIDVVNAGMKRIGIDSKNFRMVEGTRLYRFDDVPNEYSSTVSEQTFLDLLECEREFLVLSDRSIYWPNSVRERLRLYRRLLQFWIGFLERNDDIRVVFFETTPHMGWDLVLFYVARYLGRRTRIIIGTHLNDRSLINNHYREMPYAPAGYLAENSADEILAEIGIDQVAAIAEQSLITDYAQKLNEGFLRWQTTSTFRQLFDRTSPIRRLARRNWIRHKKRSDPFNSAIAGNRQTGPLEDTWLVFKEMGHLKRLRRAYEDLCKPVDRLRPYIFFGMHMQPERSTAPEGGWFTDQTAAIRILSNAVPEGWTVCVKDHPLQYDVGRLHLKRRLARDAADLEEIAALPNVRLVSLLDPAHGLISNAQAVATITGSIGLEALTMGKPVIAFGFPWYMGCESCFRITDPGALGTFIQSELGDHSTEVVQYNLARHLHFIRSVSKPVTMHTNKIRPKTPLFDELVGGLGDEILRLSTSIDDAFDEPAESGPGILVKP